jgi:VWFA-related protein
MAILILFLPGFSFAASESGVSGLDAGTDSNVQQRIQNGFALKVDVDSVFLNVSVRERDTNRSLSGLQKNDFVVYEDGVQQQINQFLPTESPFNLLLLLDVSGSTGSYIKLMKQAAVQFVREINADDKIAVATFNSSVRLIQDFTNDRDQAERAIQHIKSGGGTAFYDALSTAIDHYLQGIRGRTAIVVFTDGVDSQLEGMPESGSRITFDELYRKVEEADTMVYTIFLDTEWQPSGFSGNGPGAGPGAPGWPQHGGFRGAFSLPFPFPRSAAPKPRQDDDEDAIYRQARGQLELIAEQTAGRMYSPRKLDELSGAYSEVADDLRVQYQLGYNSSNRALDGKWREIKVELENIPAAIVRTRKGYYARMEPSQ